MPRRADLARKLRELHDELEASEELDAEERAALIALRDDIEQLLELSSEATVAQRDAVQTGVGGAVDQLEARYPRITHALNAILESLSSLGI